MERHYSKEEVKEAVDIVIGDDGFRSKEVIEVLNTFDEEKETLYIEDKVERYCEKRLDTDG
tara:strand:- start:3052 stop:3234 length:183 start_codon:yes stop_codon:yes gene_type:complete